jgi:hypothetical protein
MSESPIGLVLGIIGTVTGIFALFISYWTYRKAKPHLKLKVTKCVHEFMFSRSQVKHITFWSFFQIRNLGDRGTRIREVELTFKIGTKKYTLRKYEPREKLEHEQTIWVEAHDTALVGAYFTTPFDSNEEERIECTFITYHTHGVNRINAVSNREKFIFGEMFESQPKD